MKATTSPNMLLSFVKAIIFTSLATLSFGVNAGSCNGKTVYYEDTDTMYVGNPSRLNTIWVPGHCGRGGCWTEGYYLKIDANMPIPKRQMMWVGDQYDKCGNFVPGHYYYKPLYKPGYWSHGKYHYYRTICHG